MPKREVRQDKGGDKTSNKQNFISVVSVRSEKETELVHFRIEKCAVFLSCGLVHQILYISLKIKKLRLRMYRQVHLNQKSKRILA
jgi:hypothetical protein